MITNAIKRIKYTDNGKVSSPDRNTVRRTNTATNYTERSFRCRELLRFLLPFVVQSYHRARGCQLLLKKLQQLKTKYYDSNFFISWSLTPTNAPYVLNTIHSLTLWYFCPAERQIIKIGGLKKWKKM